MVLDFRLDGKGVYDEDYEDYEESCTVMSAALELADVALTLVCLDAMNEVSVHEINVTLDPPATVPPLTAGDEVTLRVSTDVVFEYSTRFIAILDAEQELALAFVAAAGLPAPAFLAPLLTTPAAVCPQTCPDMACGFIISECPCDERLAIDFSVGGEPVRVYDGNLATPVPALPYDLRVEAARCHDGPTDSMSECSYPHCWYHFLVLRVP